MIPRMYRLKSFCSIVSPETIQCSFQLYTDAILMAFMTNGQYQFFPQITDLKSDDARSSRSTPPILRSYAAITVVIKYLFPFFFYPSLCISYRLLSIRTTSNYNNRIVIPSYNFNVAITPDIKRSPFVFLHFFNINWRIIHYRIISHCPSCPESLGFEVTYQ